MEKKKEITNMPSQATLSSSSATLSSTLHITSKPSYLGPAPMDLSAAQNQTERDRIYQERQSGGLCPYCRTAGHFQATCPRPKRRQMVTEDATIAPRAEEASMAEKD